MNRREFIRVMAAGAASAALPASPAGAAEAKQPAARRPNILLVIGDDHTFEDIGCYGNKEVRTPNIDRLGADGMRFTRAFTATAMCAPTRQQLYTGIFPIRNGAYPNHSYVKAGTKSIVHHLKELGYRVGLSGKTHIGPQTSFPFETVPRNGIEKFISKEKNEPYCLIVASNNPHEPWTEGDATKHDTEKLTVPPYMVDTPATRTALAKYLAEIEALDAEVGECMEIVRKSGQEENTIFIYTSEQGSSFPHCKWTCYDTGLHVAFILRWPERVKAGSVANAMVQYVDVVPTLVEAVGGQVPDGLDGRSFLPVLLGEADRHNEVVYGVHTTRGTIMGSPCYPIRSIRTETHKYIRNLNHTSKYQNVVTGSGSRSYWGSWVEKARTDKQAAAIANGYQVRPEEELYDPRNDPYELTNLADDPALAELKASLRAKLEAWMKQQGDLGVETEMKVNAWQGGGKAKAQEKEK